jgi:hypothetical protein
MKSSAAGATKPLNASIMAGRRRSVTSTAHHGQQPGNLFGYVGFGHLSGRNFDPPTVLLVGAIRSSSVARRSTLFAICSTPTANFCPSKTRKAWNSGSTIRVRSTPTTTSVRWVLVTRTGEFGTAINHVFLPSVVEGVDIFKQPLPQGGGSIYLSERFVQRWRQAKLKGLVFGLAWDSDLPPEKQPNVSLDQWK